MPKKACLTEKLNLYWKKSRLIEALEEVQIIVSLPRGSRTDGYKNAPGDGGKEKTSRHKVKYFTSKSGQPVTARQLVECGLGHL